MQASNVFDQDSGVGSHTQSKHSKTDRECKKSNIRDSTCLVARAIRNAIGANRFARIICNQNPYFYSASGRFARITRISDSRESLDSRESCESIRANHATKSTCIPNSSQGNLTLHIGFTQGNLRQRTKLHTPKSMPDLLRGKTGAILRYKSSTYVVVVVQDFMMGGLWEANVVCTGAGTSTTDHFLVAHTPFLNTDVIEGVKSHPESRSGLSGTTCSTQL